MRDAALAPSGAEAMLLPHEVEKAKEPKISGSGATVRNNDSASTKSVTKTAASKKHNKKGQPRPLNKMLSSSPVTLAASTSISASDNDRPEKPGAGDLRDCVDTVGHLSGSQIRDSLRHLHT